LYVKGSRTSRVTLRSVSLPVASKLPVPVARKDAASKCAAGHWATAFQRVIAFGLAGLGAGGIDLDREP
jgi:hypothetical protein